MHSFERPSLQNKRNPDRNQRFQAGPTLPRYSDKMQKGRLSFLRADIAENGDRTARTGAVQLRLAADRLHL